MRQIRPLSTTFRAITGAALTLALVMAGALSASASTVTSPEVEITASGETSTQAPIIQSASNGTLVALTVETASSVSVVLARISSDGGTTWGAAQQLSTAGLSVPDADFVVLGDGSLGAVWGEPAVSSGQGHVVFARSTDSGATWSIRTSAIGTAAPHGFDAAANGASGLSAGYIADSGTGGYRARVQTMLFATNQMTQSQAISTSGITTSNVAIAANSAGDVAATWVEAIAGAKTNYAATSASWSTVETLSSYSYIAFEKPADIASTNTGNFVVAWSDPTSNSTPYFPVATKVFSGSTWSATTRIGNSGFDSFLTLAPTNDGGATLVWRHEIPSVVSLQSVHLSSAGVWGSVSTAVPSASGQLFDLPTLTALENGTLVLGYALQVSMTVQVVTVQSSDFGVTWGNGGNVSSWIDPAMVTLSVTALSPTGFAVGWIASDGQQAPHGFGRVFDATLPASNGGSSSSGSALAATGATVAAPLGAAFALLIVGAAVWLLARRKQHG